MDFLSDYLADSRAGAFATAATAVTPGASIEGQFVTLEQNGLFYVTAFGTGVDPATMQRSLRNAVDQVTGRQ